MTRIVPRAGVLLAGLLIAGAASAQQPAANLSFEEPDSAAPHQPAAWFVHHGDRWMGRDSSIAQSGRFSLQSSTPAAGGSPNVAGQEIALDGLRGREVVLRGWIRTQDVRDGFAGLWLRVDGPVQADGIPQQLALENMQERAIRGTTEWARHEVSAFVDEDATALHIGALHVGAGVAWFDGLELGLVEPSDVEAAALTDAQIDQLRRHAHPLRTAAPGAPFDDLDALAPMFESARIVALGEGTHGTRQFFQLKHRIVEWLTHRAGPGARTAFAIEANMTEAQRVNDYVLTGRGNARDAIAGLYFWTWNTEEVVELVEWMRRYNASGAGRVEFWGFDAQIPSVAIDSVLAFLARVDSASHPLARDEYTRVRAAWDARTSRTANDAALVDSASAAARRVHAMLEAARERHVRAAGDSAADWALQNARIVVQAIDAMSLAVGQGGGPRDVGMADNVAWILDRLPDGTKLILWAHNGHIQRESSWMGRHLADRFGDAYRPVGFTTGAGWYRAVGRSGMATHRASAPPDRSFEGIAAALGEPIVVVDLRALRTQPGAAWLREPLMLRTIGAVASAFQFRQTRIVDAYDAMIYVAQSSPTRQAAPASRAQ